MDRDYLLLPIDGMCQRSNVARLRIDNDDDRNSSNGRVGKVGASQLMMSAELFRKEMEAGD